MQRITCVIVLLAISASIAFGESGRREIVGGTRVTVHEYPSALFVAGCSGSLVAERWALTAAHCVAGKHPIGLEVERGYPEAYESHRSTRVVIHPKYVHNPNWTLNDVALVQFDRPFQSSSVQVANLANDALLEILLQPGTMTTSVGYGRIDGDRPSDALWMAQWPIAPCPSEFESYVATRNDFCRKQVPGVSQINNGDSGGPVYVQFQSELWQVGWATYQANAIVNGVWQYYSISHKTGAYLQWIQNVIGGPEPPTVEERLQDLLDRVTDLEKRVEDLESEASVAPPPTPPTSPTDPPGFVPQQIHVALGTSGDLLTLMTTEAGGYTLNGEAFGSGMLVTSERNGSTYQLILNGDGWAASYVEPDPLNLSLGTTGGAVLVRRREDGSYSVNGSSLTSGMAVVAENGNMYVITITSDGTFFAAYVVPPPLTIPLGTSGSTVDVVKNEDGTFSIANGEVITAATQVTAANGSKFRFVLSPSGVPNGVAEVVDP